MDRSDIFLLAADFILVVHFAIVVFIVGGFLAILVGNWQQWHWIKNRAFRYVHLVAIGIVVLQAWLGRLCPLTVWETALREKSGQSGYSETFVQYWVHRILFYDAPTWLFALLYSLFGLLVFGVWWWEKGRRRG
jgi:hypothetical protein